MYSPEERADLLEQLQLFIRRHSEFEGLLQIGSGALGFTDNYSDIDLMAGCYDLASVAVAEKLLTDFFMEQGVCHLEKRAWSKSALGLSAYFENGLSVDFSFLPTWELPIRSPRFRILDAKTDRFREVVSTGEERLTGNDGVDDAIHYRFINELRYVEIALLRGQCVFADIALGRARQLLLSVETVREGKVLHQFKAYDTLEKEFLIRLEETYPKSRTSADLTAAKEKLLKLYLDTVERCRFLDIEPGLLKLLGCFEQIESPSREGVEYVLHQ